MLKAIKLLTISASLFSVGIKNEVPNKINKAFDYEAIDARDKKIVEHNATIFTIYFFIICSPFRSSTHQNFFIVIILLITIYFLHNIKFYNYF